MLTRPKAARGKVVYGNGAIGPNTGRVSAQGIQGYVKREQRNRVGNLGLGTSKFGGDGQSDTRSGLAAKALRRNSSFGPAKKPNRPGNSNFTPGPGSSNSGSHAGGGAGTTPLSANPINSQVTVNDVGTLQLPYDDQWSSDVIAAMGDYNTELLSLQQQQQQQALDYMNQNQALNQGYHQTKQDTLNLGAGSGAAFSSAYGSAVAKDALNYQNSKNQLDSENNLFNQGINQQKLAIQHAFEGLLRQDALTRAANAALEAGTLGYGQSGSGKGGKGKSGGKSGAGKNGGGSGKSGGGAKSNSHSGGNSPGKAQFTKPKPQKQPYNNEGRQQALAQQAMKKGKKK